MGDFHTGHSVGMMPPRYYLGEQLITYSPAQKIIWEHYQALKRKVKKLEGRKIGVLNGDLIDGDNPRHNTWTNRPKEQRDAFLYNMEPMLGVMDQWVVIRGTPAHVGDHGVIEDDIAKELGALDLKSHMKVELTIQGVRFVFAHQGPTVGKRRHVEGNQLRILLRDMCIRAAEEGKEAADVYCWSHFHQYIHEMVTFGGREVHGFILPAWCLASDYAMKVVQHLEAADLGTVYFTVDNGVWQVHKHIKSLDMVRRVSYE